MPKTKTLETIARGRDGDMKRFLTPGDATELIDSVIRTAIREQARMLEKHLRDIDSRLKQLENKRR